MKNKPLGKIIGILGGSFDPPHLGHVAICQELLREHKVDEVWVVPTFQHAFGKELSSFADRYSMCLFAFNKLPTDKVKVLDVEKQLGGVSYTALTVLHLKNTFPQHVFRLILGEDQAASLEKWKDRERLEKMAPFLWVQRGAQSKIPNIASSEIRRRLASGEGISDLVSKEVAVYIATKQLYR